MRPSPVSVLMSIAWVLGIWVCASAFSVAPVRAAVCSPAAAGDMSDPKDDEAKQDDKDPPPEPEPEEEEDEAEAEEKPKKFEIDPELQKKIDELFETERSRGGKQAREAQPQRKGQARQPRAPRITKPRTPPPREAQPQKPAKPVTRAAPGKPVVEVPAGPSTQLSIPAIESDVPPEERIYVFSIKDGTYEQLLEGFARQTGLGVSGEAPRDGKVTFVSPD